MLPASENESGSRTLILDLGDVLFPWSTRELTAISPSTFHAVLLTPAWNSLERGLITEPEALEAIGKELSLGTDTIREALTQCRNTLRVDHDLIAELKALKAEMDGKLKFHAMTNITRDDFARLKAALPSWDLFDGEFTSFEAGMVKPELGYYKYVLDEVKQDPTTVIFVDDKVANVNATSSFGMHSILFSTPKSLIRSLRAQFFDPIARGREYMKAKARNHVSQIEGGGPLFRDVFSQFIIYKVLPHENIISLSPPGTSGSEIDAEIEKCSREARSWNYFIGSPVGTTDTFPDDVDDTAMALLAFSPPKGSADPVLDRFLSNRHKRDGLVQIYLDEKRARVCPVVLINVCRVFYQYNLGAHIQKELTHIRNVLVNRGYIHGTLHYISAEPFLFFLSCLVDEAPGAPEIKALREPLAAALRDRVGRQDDAFAGAVRVLACQSLGVWCGSDTAYLKELQQSDGGWETGWVCRYGRSRRRIGSRGVATAIRDQGA